ncbi:unnamed protein product [Cylindrotheca closterium]|uniref:Glycosyltransferase 61 catalytic domain-containing protein n=1 Tax=Cylindrotheca closterium TaxID=2856 RepID=A0AAD2G669_9STRA|nr:unnamed protein product [Cylindrotheca closterium]
MLTSSPSRLMLPSQYDDESSRNSRQITQLGFLVMLMVLHTFSGGVDTTNFAFLKNYNSQRDQRSTRPRSLRFIQSQSDIVANSSNATATTTRPAAVVTNHVMYTNFSSSSSTTTSSNTTTTTTTSSSSSCILQPNNPMTKVTHPIPDPPPVVEEGIEEVFCRMHENIQRHFPHAMQQLYRCYSMWRDYPKAKPYLTVPDSDWQQWLYRHPFLNGLMAVFHKQMHMSTIVEEDYSLQMLQAYENSNVTIFQTVVGSDYSIRHVRFLQDIVQKELQLDDGGNEKSRDSCSSGTGSQKKPRIGILNRSHRHNRSIINANEIATAIQRFSRNDTVKVKYFEGSYFEEQVAFFQSVDIVLSPHGAQLAGLALMNAPCGHVVELFPKGYSVPNFFGSLSVESEKNHSYIYMSANSSRFDQAKTRKQRAKARETNFCPSVDMLTDSIRRVADEWRQCCEESNRT